MVEHEGAIEAGTSVAKRSNKKSKGKQGHGTGEALDTLAKADNPGEANGFVQQLRDCAAYALKRAASSHNAEHIAIFESIEAARAQEERLQGLPDFETFGPVDLPLAQVSKMKALRTTFIGMSQGLYRSLISGDEDQFSESLGGVVHHLFKWAALNGLILESADTQDTRKKLQSKLTWAYAQGSDISGKDIVRWLFEATGIDADRAKKLVR